MLVFVLGDGSEPAAVKMDRLENGAAYRQKLGYREKMAAYKQKPGYREKMAAYHRARYLKIKETESEVAKQDRLKKEAAYRAARAGDRALLRTLRLIDD